MTTNCGAFLSESELLRAWDENSESWALAIGEQLIASRAFTNDAILLAVGDVQGLEVLDLGCGEGWLSRRLSASGARVLGVDGSRALIERAKELGSSRGETYIFVDYQDLPEVNLRVDFDLVVANFSLLGCESAEAALASIRASLKANGRFLIQTLHPKVMAREDSCWVCEDWRAFPSLGFKESPWYYRTMDDWLDLLARSGFCRAQEPQIVRGRQGDLLSIIFSLKLRSLGRR